MQLIAHLILGSLPPVQPMSIASPHFPVISRFVGGVWTNTYKIFDGSFNRQEDRVRQVEWSISGAQCTVTLTAGEQKISLSGEHTGDGVVDFSAEGLPFVYGFHQVGTDTLLVSRTEVGGESSRLDCGSIVLTSDDTCLQTIVHLEDGVLQMLEVITGEREAGK